MYITISNLRVHRRIFVCLVLAIFGGVWASAVSMAQQPSADCETLRYNAEIAWHEWQSWKEGLGNNLLMFVGVKCGENESLKDCKARVNKNFISSRYLEKDIYVNNAVIDQGEKRVLGLIDKGDYKSLLIGEYRVRHPQAYNPEADINDKWLDATTKSDRLKQRMLRENGFLDRLKEKNRKAQARLITCQEKDEAPLTLDVSGNWVHRFGVADTCRMVHTQTGEKIKGKGEYRGRTLEIEGFLKYIKCSGGEDSTSDKNFIDWCRRKFENESIWGLDGIYWKTPHESERDRGKIQFIFYEGAGRVFFKGRYQRSGEAKWTEPWTGSR